MNFVNIEFNVICYVNIKWDRFYLLNVYKIFR